MVKISETALRTLPKLVDVAGKNHRTLAAFGILALTAVLVVHLWTRPGFSQVVGSDSVVMGQISPNARIGDRSVVIGATDSRGNTILNAPMAVGNGACAGPGSIAIGTNAGAGSCQWAVEPTK